MKRSLRIGEWVLVVLALGMASIEFWVGNSSAAVPWLLVAFVFGTTERMLHHMYQAGWFGGRGAMIESLPEAADRGLTLDEWLDAELERDNMHWLVEQRRAGRAD